MELIRAKKTSLSLDLAPLIDVVFLLLVFFMLTTTFANPSIKMILPKASFAWQEPQTSQVTVSVNEFEQVFINGRLTTFVKLKEEMNQSLRDMKSDSITIEAHKDMPYSIFVQIMDMAKQAGVERINIVHQKFN